MGCNQLCFRSLIREKHQHIIMMLLTVAIPGGLGEGGYKFNTTHRWAPSGAPARKASQLTAPYSFTFLVNPKKGHQVWSFVLPFCLSWCFDHMICNNKKTEQISLQKARLRQTTAEVYSMGWCDCFGSILSPGSSHQPDRPLISTLLPYAAKQLEIEIVFCCNIYKLYDE